ncbi:MAG: MerR family transcriptional regulator [Sedimentisphaerales bacterium]|nr:MerR family transcriptional regulator [Sedimentisphaerales bacterium]
MGPIKGLFSIGSAAKLAGVSRQSLQYYIMVGLLEPADVTNTGRRLFDQRSVERIKLIKKLNKSGYPLWAIRELFLEGRTGRQKEKGKRQKGK